MITPYAAVITGDIVHSTNYDAELVLHHMKAALDYVLRDVEVATTSYDSYEISRGDSFQFFLPQAELALRKAFEIRAHLRTANINTNAGRKEWKEKMNYKLDARLAIGISNKNVTLQNTLGETSGEAFLLSGRSLDAIKKTRQNIVASSTNNTLDTWLNVCLRVAEQSIAAWSAEQAAVILAALRGATQQSIAEASGISQAAVQQRLKKANWPALKELLTVFSSVITRPHADS